MVSHRHLLHRGLRCGDDICMGDDAGTFVLVRRLGEGTFVHKSCWGLGFRGFSCGRLREGTFAHKSCWGLGFRGCSCGRLRDGLKPCWTALQQTFPFRENGIGEVPSRFPGVGRMGEVLPMHEITPVRCSRTFHNGIDFVLFRVARGFHG